MLRCGHPGRRRLERADPVLQATASWRAPSSVSGYEGYDPARTLPSRQGAVGRRPDACLRAGRPAWLAQLGRSRPWRSPPRPEQGGGLGLRPPRPGHHRRSDRPMLEQSGLTPCYLPGPGPHPHAAQLPAGNWGLQAIWLLTSWAPWSRFRPPRGTQFFEEARRIVTAILADYVGAPSTPRPKRPSTSRPGRSPWRQGCPSRPKRSRFGSRPWVPVEGTWGLSGDPSGTE